MVQNDPSQCVRYLEVTCTCTLKIDFIRRVDLISFASFGRLKVLYYNYLFKAF